MKAGVRRFVWFLLVAVALLIAALLAGLIPLNLGFLKGPIANATRASIGLDLSIGDPLIVRLGANPAISTGDVHLGDQVGGRLVDVASLKGRVSLWALIKGRIHLLEARASGVHFNYCGPRPGTVEGDHRNTPSRSIAVDDVAVSDVVIGCDDTRQSKLPEILISRIVATAPLDVDAEIDAEGTIAGQAYSLNAVGGELNRLLTREAQYPVNVLLESAQSAISAAARVSLPTGIDAEIEVRVADLSSLLAPFGIEAPPLGKLALNGSLRSDFRRIDAQAVTGTLGNSHFAFDAGLEIAAERPKVRLTAILDYLDVAPLVVGKAEMSHVRQSGRAPDVDLGLLLRGFAAIDAEVDVEVREIGGLPVAVAAAKLAGSLDEGRLELRSFAADVLGGRLSASGLFNGRLECPQLAFEARIDGLLFDSLTTILPTRAEIGGGAETIALKAGSCGNSLHAHRDSLSATLDLKRGSASYDGKPIPMTAERLEIMIAPSQRLRARLSGPLVGVPVDVVLSAGTPAAVSTGKQWPLDIIVSSAGGKLSARGRASLARGSEFLDVAVELEVPRLGALHAWTGTAPEADLPLRGAARVHLNPASLVAEKLSVSAGASDFGGRFAWRFTDDQAPVDIRLRSGRLDLAEVAAAFPLHQSSSDKAGQAAAPGRVGIARRIALPPVDLDVLLEDVHARKLDLQDVAVRGRLRKGLIDDAEVSMLVEQDVELRGALDLDVRTLPATASLRFEALNLDIGQLVHRMGLDPDVRMRADGIDIHVSTQGSTLQELVVDSLVEAELRGFSWQIPKTVPGDDEPPAEAFDLSLDRLNFATAPNRPTTWSSGGRFDDVVVELWMQTPSLVDTIDNDGELPVSLAVAANDNVAMLDAVFDLAREDGLGGRLLLSGAIIASEDRSLERLKSPLPDYGLSASVSVSERRIELSDVRMRLGSSSAAGSVTIAGGERRQVEVILKAPHLQTEDLLYWSTDFQRALSSTATETRGALPDRSAETLIKPAPTKSRGVIPIVSDFVATLQNRNDVTLSIRIDELAAGISPLGSAALDLHIDENEFRLEPVEIALPGGGVNARYVTRLADGYLKAELTVNADALSYGGLLRLADPDSEARGLLFLDTEIGTNTATVPGRAPLNLLLENASGHFSIASWPENIRAGVLDLWSANVIVALLPAPSAEEASRLNCLTGNFEIRDGIMQSTTSLLDTTDTIIRGRGTIDLGQEQLELLVWPQAKREKFLSVSTPITVTGSFDDFRVGVEPAGLIGRVIRWYTSLIYVPFKWLTGERFSADGTSTCFNAMGWELTPELEEYFLRRDFSAPPVAY